MVDKRFIAEVLAERKIAKAAIPDVLEYSFPQQKAFILDKSVQKALFCTRRSAKSFTAGLSLIYQAIHNPGCNCLFIGLTRDSAKLIIWKDILTVINDKSRSEIQSD